VQLAQWHIGNTTVRTPYRLKEALQVLKNSEFHRNLLGREREEGFARLLNEKSVVRADRIKKTPGADSSDLGRKWRSALAQLGFVVMHLTKGHKVGVDPRLKSFISNVPGLSGIPYEITPSGNRLINAESVAEQQECFLRALIAYKIPSIFENRYEFKRFSPLRFVLEILLNLESQGEEQLIKFDEMALIVQRRTGDDGVSQTVSEIISYRTERNKAENKKKYANDRLLEAMEENRAKAGTSRDYADLNFRYLKATGLFQANGHAITIIPEKHALVELLLSGFIEDYEDSAYVKNLWEGAKLPTDDRINSLNIIRHLSAKLEEHGEKPDFIDIKEKSMDELSAIRHKLEYKLQCLKERVYADSQSSLWEDIADYMKVFQTSRRRRVSRSGEELSIPPGEAPAYFEWITWRAFLAIDSFTNNPWEARRFKVDQDFFPLSHAPAGGPDMIFEFEEYVLVVEVTLTSSSRQEAVEGEPVRRHVAGVAKEHENTGKKVYCLFISPQIDSNTAETFKIGNWYKADDTKLSLQVVPITIGDFISLFEAIFESESGRISPGKIEYLLVYCRSLSNRDAPEWKKEISNEVKRFIAKL
jgi:hypothetical protein